MKQNIILTFFFVLLKLNVIIVVKYFDIKYKLK